VFDNVCQIFAKNPKDLPDFHLFETGQIRGILSINGEDQRMVIQILVKQSLL